MSKEETNVPEPLRAAGGTNFERRLLEAASHEQPSRELSERMAQAIGISLPAASTASMGDVKTGPAAANAPSIASSLAPWLSGTLVAVGMALGAYVLTRPSAKTSTPSAGAPSALSEAALSTASRSATLASPLPILTAPPPAVPPANADEESRAKTPALPSLGGRKATTTGELANQIALVDAARSALARGAAERALALALEYQKAYPSGTFRPEVSAVKIEALLKLGRAREARALAEKFASAYGPGPLADRVARLAHVAQP